MLQRVLCFSCHLLLLWVLLPVGLGGLVQLLHLELVDGRLAQLHLHSYPLLLLVLLLEDHHLELVLQLGVMLLSDTQGPGCSRYMRSSANKPCPGYS